MSKKLQILYPRRPAKFLSSTNTNEKTIMRQIAALENGKVIKRYKKLQELLHIERSDIPRFVCGNCSEEFKIKDLTLHRFVSYSKTMDNDRYNDDNVICPKCGFFNYVEKEDSYKFKNIEEIYE